MLDFMLDPATNELIWTLAVTTLLLVSGGLTIALMPWTNAEIMEVHRTMKAAAAAHVPVPLSTTALSAREPQHPRPLASA